MGVETTRHPAAAVEVHDGRSGTSMVPTAQLGFVAPVGPDGNGRSSV